MPKFTEIEFDEFGSKIGYSNGGILLYLDSYYRYFRNSYPVMVRFFNGELDKISADVFIELKRLIDVAEDVAQSIAANNYLLIYLKDWEITDYLEELRMELYRMQATSKFLRSSKNNVNFDGSIEFEYILPQGKTLEDIAKDVLGSNSYEDLAVEIAARNDLSEVDYDSKGGNNLFLQIQLTTRNSQVKSVVDNISGKRVFGLDLDKKLTFSNDDLKVLTYDKTIFQAVVILANLVRGSVPEFKNFGRSNVVGRNKQVLGDPSLVREMSKVFSSDDTLVKFTMTNFRVVSDAILIDFTVDTRLETMIKQTVKI